MIRGPLKKAPPVKLVDHTPILVRPPHSLEETDSEWMGSIWPDLGYTHDPLKEISDSWCLCINRRTTGDTEYLGLLLCEKEQVYSRVGVFIIRDNTWWDDARTETIVIV